MISTMTVRVDRLAAAAPVGFSLATEVADWLVRKGVPFRDAHEITGRLVALCVGPRSASCDEVSDDDLATVSEHLDPSVRDGAVGPLGAGRPDHARARPGPGPVADQLAAATDQLDGWREWAIEQVVPR